MPPYGHGQAQQSKEGDNLPRRDDEGAHEDIKDNTTINTNCDDEDLFLFPSDDKTAKAKQTNERGKTDIRARPTNENDDGHGSVVVMICQLPNERMMEIAK